MEADGFYESPRSNNFYISSLIRLRSLTGMLFGICGGDLLLSLSSFYLSSSLDTSGDSKIICCPFWD